jgi:hypothetical protein
MAVLLDIAAFKKRNEHLQVLAIPRPEILSLVLEREPEGGLFPHLLIAERPGAVWTPRTGNPPVLAAISGIKVANDERAMRVARQRGTSFGST